jgi:two-component system chemotaxis response regulator CheB
MTAKIRVLIVEDSPTVRVLLEHVVSGDPRFELAGSVASAEEMLAVLDAAAPDVISMDVRLPGMNGLDATLEVMRRRPTPIVVVAADVDAPDLGIEMNALRAGALAVVEKPVGVEHAAYGAIADRLRAQLALMSRVKVVRQVRSRAVGFGSAPPDHEPEGREAPAAVPGRVRSGFAALGLVASTGGPTAVSQVLGQLGPGFPLPILLVQHILGSFLPGFADWLRTVAPFRTRIVRDGEAAEPGVVHLPPADRHLVLDGDRLRLTDAPPEDGQRPSGTVMLRSLASAGRGGIGVVLTGMGEDGARGLLEMRRAGGHTIAEDEATAVVFGMPGAAKRLGAARETLPLPEIGPRIRALVAAEREARA